MIAELDQTLGNERLAVLIEELNAEQDDAARVEIFQRITRLRQLLGLKEGTP